MARSWCIKMPPFATLILYLFLSVYSTYYASSLETNHTVQEINELEKIKMVKKYIQKTNKHAKKTIKSPDGDVIDCILFHKQPAFNNPLLKRKISMVPPKLLNNFNSTYTIQLWNGNGDKCPKGTIPIRRTIPINRTREEDVLRAGQIKRFGMKHNHFSNDDNPGGNHEYVIAKSVEGNWTKTKASLSVWKPHVAAKEMSLCQLWVIAGTNFNKLNAVEAGWHVYPRHYRERRPSTRFFIYWTNNTYEEGYGCYNMECPGFVQISDALIPGAAFNESRISVYDGPQYNLALEIEWSVDRNWWLKWYSDIGIIPIGYWPGHIFDHLNGPAISLDFGGEISNKRHGGHHTITEMGSGHFSSEGLGRAAYVSEIEFQGHGRSSNASLTTVITNRNCYDLTATGTPQLGVSFFYGGPGRGPQCP